jgi:hypothetical protein
MPIAVDTNKAHSIIRKLRAKIESDGNRFTGATPSAEAYSPRS